MRSGCGTIQKPLDAEEQLVGLEGFDHVVVGPSLEAADAVSVNSRAELVRSITALL